MKGLTVLLVLALLVAIVMGAGILFYKAGERSSGCGGSCQQTPTQGSRYIQCPCCGRWFEPLTRRPYGPTGTYKTGEVGAFK